MLLNFKSAGSRRQVSSSKKLSSPADDHTKVGVRSAQVATGPSDATLILLQPLLESLAHFVDDDGKTSHTLLIWLLPLSCLERTL
jgi:hypothetical protein